MAKNFKTFGELIEFRKTCLLCSNNLTYKITTYTSDKKNSIGRKASIKQQIENHFNNVMNRMDLPEDGGGPKIKKVVAEFKPTVDDRVEIEELGLIFKPRENIALVKDFDVIMDILELEIYCPHEAVGNGYYAKGSFDFTFGIDIEKLEDIPRNEGMFVFAVDLLKLGYETFKIINVHLEDEKPNGNLIKIINDYSINKTSFSMAEMNLDGTCGTWKEKRIDLVPDNFFKFANSEKVYSRINAIFLLQ